MSRIYLTCIATPPLLRVRPGYHILSPVDWIATQAWLVQLQDRPGAGFARSRKSPLFRIISNWRQSAPILRTSASVYLRRLHWREAKQPRRQEPKQSRRFGRWRLACNRLPDLRRDGQDLYRMVESGPGPRCPLPQVPGQGQDTSQTFHAALQKRTSAGTTWSTRR